MFTCAWKDVVMIHYEVSAKLLQAVVPFELDLYHDVAFVSLVAFNLKDMHFYRGGNWTRWMTLPISTHAFLNVRTYVKHRGKKGIYFLAEWVPNVMSRLLGPMLYGLPYRWGSLDYKHQQRLLVKQGRVEGINGKALKYELIVGDECLTAADKGTVDHFLLERYEAFTEKFKVRRVFKVEHEPWFKREVSMNLQDDSLLQGLGSWVKQKKFLKAHDMPGFESVRMYAPQVC